MLRKHAIEINAVVLGLRQECVGHSWPRQLSAPLLFCPTLAHLNNRAETREGSSGGCRWMQEVFCWTAWTVTSDWCFWPQKHSLLGIMCFREEQRRTCGLQDGEREWRPQKHCTYTGQEVFNTHIKCYVITVFYCSRVTFSQQTAMWFYSWDHSVRSSNGDCAESPASQMFLLRKRPQWFHIDLNMNSDISHHSPEIKWSELLCTFIL